MRLMLLAAVGLLFLCGCQCDTALDPNPFGASPDCAPAALAAAPDDCGPVYTGPQCPNIPFLTDGADWINENIFGCLPKTPIATQVVAAPPLAAPLCATPVAAAPQQWGHCGPPPANAKLGENWCCVFVQPMAAPAVRVCTREASRIAIPVAAVHRTEHFTVQVAPARTEWRKINCEGQEGDCYQLVEVPPVMETRARQVCVQPASVRYEEVPAEFAMRASAPPPGYWEWQLREDCQPPAASAALGSPPDLDSK